MQLELMNMRAEPKDVYLTLDYEYIPGPRPQGWKIAKAMWLDITNCGISSVNPPRGKMQFKMASRPWTSSYDGELLGVGGHLHDGGLTVNIYQNKQVICASQAQYGVGSSDGSAVKNQPPTHGDSRASTPKGGAPAKALPSSDGHQMVRRDGGPHGGMDGKPHIKAMTVCTNMGKIKKGDTFYIDANYDFTKHEGMKSPAGAYTEVMGIAIMYAAANPPELSGARSLSAGTPPKAQTAPKG